jgi:hypothetical protein
MTQEQDIFASLNVSKILVAILEMQNEITIPSDGCRTIIPPSISAW